MPQNAIAAHHFQSEAQWGVKVSKGKCSVKTARLRVPATVGHAVHEDPLRLLVDS